MRLAGQTADPARCHRCLLEQIGFAIDAAVDVIQIREPGLAGHELEELTRAAVRLAAGTRTLILVNDRADVALACGAGGVHLKADSAPASMVRAMLPEGFVIGCSVHSVGEARAVARHVDYITAGTIWQTASKSGSLDLLGLAGFAEIARAVNVPVLGIGGVTPERIRDVATAGGSGVAAIGLFMEAADSREPEKCRAIPLHRIAQDARQI